ncbi:MAG: amino acid adenylation domain-containing protein, partial [Chitinophagaceae bacterium]
TIEEQGRIIAKEKITRFREIELVPLQESYELSHAQKRLWILSQLENTSIAYNMHGAFLFEGALNKNALVNAFTELIKRHESLRTIFITSNGEPRQKIIEPADINFHLNTLDISENPARNGLAEKLATKEAITPFDLSKGPLLRASLIGLEKNKSVLLFTMHHIIGDGWSMGVLLNETLTLYNNFNKNKQNGLTPLRIQYKDYAAWQNAQLQGDLFAKNKKYWLSQLGEDEIPVLELPYDKPRPRVQTFNGDRIDFLLDKTLVKKLDTLCKEKEVTFFVGLLAAVKTLFYKYTGQTDIVIGSPIAGREHVDLENQIGFYVNTLVLRTRFLPGNSYEQLLSIIKEESINAYEHQLYPFDRLVDDLDLQKDLSRSAVFDVMVALQNTELNNNRPVAMEGIEISNFPSKRMVSMFDLTISFSEEGEGYLTSMEYNTDLFNRSTIIRLGEHFTALLSALVSAPGKPINQISYINIAEERKLLDINDSLFIHPYNKTAIQLFEKQVEKTPGKAAIEYDGTILTYREINIKATELASFLAKSKKIVSQDIIAIQLERSPQAVFAILAVLKLNAVYLPLDINTPVERLTYVLQDSKAKLLLTASEYEDLSIPCLNPEKIEYEAFDQELTSMEVSMSDSAYIIYTSGTTGNPKGVDISHGALINYINWFTRSYNITEQDNTLLISSLGFDLGYTGFWSSLVSGATMHIMKEMKQVDPAVLMHCLIHYKISYIKLTPSHFKLLIHELRNAKAKLELRLIVLGGEPIQVENVEEYFNYDKNVTIVNHYGPTETTIGTIAATINSKNFNDFKRMPHIGKPIDNARVYILDNDGHLAPQGIRGEICIAGAGLAKGYRNHSELTIEKFVTVQVGHNKERVYKTSDVGKHTEDGNIVLLGRKDNQIKIRGYRVELEEIENTLKKYSDIENAVVTVEEYKNEKQLIAYVVAKPEASLFINGFKRYKLPNNLAIAQINKNETDYIYKEIFELQAYLKHGISLKDGDCIFDVGANIGLFSVFANMACRNPKMYAFEPNPKVYDTLSANATLYCPGIKLFNCGLAEGNKTSEFTFFEGFSLLSGLYANEKAERDMVKTFMVNQQNKGVDDMKELVSSADQILNKRFKAFTFLVQLESLSDVIERENVQQIDYLKINVEKAELDVLRGIRDEHWARIRQIVLEVDVKENLPIITTMLENNGYDLIVEQDLLLEGTTLCYVYAIRKGDKARLNKGKKQRSLHLAALPDKIISDASLRDFIRKKLPDYMMPARIIQIEKIPLTGNGKINKKALRHLSSTGIDSTRAYIAPGNEIEQKLADIWQNVLGKEKIGTNDSFFEMGGNSLKVVELFRQVDIFYPGSINVTTLFDNTTISKQADFISNKSHSSQKRADEAQIIEEIEL